MMIKKTFLSLFGLFLLGTTLPMSAQIRPEDMAEIATHSGEHAIPDSIEARYPKFDNFLRSNLDFLIPIISVEELQSKIANKEKLLLLDARSKEAYEISHLPNARRVGFDDFGSDKVWMFSRDAEIIIYCSVGSRSERVGKYMEMMGFKNVRNLYGSIYEWTNHDGAIVDKNNQPTNRVFVNDRTKLPFIRKAKPVIDVRGGDDPFQIGKLKETTIVD